jgi:hypothetical protein
MTRMMIKIGEFSFVAKLLEKEAPDTCRAILNALPIEGKVIHVRWSGEAVWLPMDPFGVEAEFENHTCHPSRGDILYYPGGISERELLIPYGATSFSSKLGPLQGNHFAEIVEGKSSLREMGLKVLWEGAQKIVIDKKSG